MEKVQNKQNCNILLNSSKEEIYFLVMYYFLNLPPITSSIPVLYNF